MSARSEAHVERRETPARRPARLARQALQRLLGALLEERLGRLEGRVERIERSQNAVVLDAAAAIEVETDVGTLWYHRDDTLIAPVVRQYGMWEPDTSALLRRTLGPGMTFVDVGANVGYFSVLASPLVGPRGFVAAVEAEPHNVALLRANLWRNGVSNCAVFPVAAHSGRSYLTMAVHDHIHDAWLAPGPGESLGPTDFDRTFRAPAARLDDLLQGRRVDVIKIDVEGADHLALRGAEATLAANPAILVVVEFQPREEVFHGETREGVLAYYESLGFRLNLLDHEGHPQPASADQVIACGERINAVNLVLTPR